jgi:hypothetical protein
VDVERDEPCFHVRSAEHPDGQLQSCGRCHVDLVQQAAAVTQGGTVIEQPRRMLAATIKDGPPVGAERLVYLTELFGDEKALDRYPKTRLFTSGALTQDLLACYDPPLPFASQHVSGNGPVILLVAENLATYTSFLTAARTLDATDRPDLHVAWGIGGSFEQSVLSIPLLDPSPRYVRYFGDLDLAGLLSRWVTGTGSA